MNPKADQYNDCAMSLEAANRHRAARVMRAAAMLRSDAALSKEAAETVRAIFNNWQASRRGGQ